MKKENKLVVCAKYLYMLYKMNISKGYLKETGWTRSHFERRVVDKHGNPIPWCTYPFISFIKERLLPGMSVFEYGAGYSTLFYSSKVRQVISIESDRAWIKLLEDMFTKQEIKNAEICYFDANLSGTEYGRLINNFDYKFDIIVVDANCHRNECMISAYDKLTDNGVIILDDSESPGYEEGQTYLKQNGFRYIDFWGINSRIYWSKCTTIFYRDGNVLGI